MAKPEGVGSGKSGGDATGLIDKDLQRKKEAPNARDAGGIGVQKAVTPGGVHVGREDVSLCPNRY